MEKPTLKTVIITGANSGLGFETAKKIASDTSFRLILACRNREKAEGENQPEIHIGSDFLSRFKSKT